MKIALVHDSLTQEGGAERVLQALHGLYPEAPVFVLVASKKLWEKYSTWDIRVSWLQRLYQIFPKFQYFFPLIPTALKTWSFKGYDLVISSSSSFAKNIHVPKNTVHIDYCHTPTRFLWLDHDYLTQELPWFLKVFRPVIGLLLKWLRRWDYKRAQQVTAFFANSREVQARIKKFYGREAGIVYPPVDTDFWHKTGDKQDYFLIAGRLQAHKNNDAVIKLFNESGLPLHVAGTGRQEALLKKLAKPNIKFLGRVSDDALRNEYSGARAFIYPQVEDFGLMPLEAAACGTASLGVSEGGSLETIIPGRTGELFDQGDFEQLGQLVRRWQQEKYRPEELRHHAERFSLAQFQAGFKKAVENIFVSANRPNHENRH